MVIFTSISSQFGSNRKNFEYLKHTLKSEEQCISKHELDECKFVIIRTLACSSISPLTPEG